MLLQKLTRKPTVFLTKLKLNKMVAENGSVRANVENGDELSGGKTRHFELVPKWHLRGRKVGLVFAGGFGVRGLVRALWRSGLVRAVGRARVEGQSVNVANFLKMPHREECRPLTSM